MWSSSGWADNTGGPCSDGHTRSMPGGGRLGPQEASTSGGARGRQAPCQEPGPVVSASTATPAPSSTGEARRQSAGVGACGQVLWPGAQSAAGTHRPKIQP